MLHALRFGTVRSREPDLVEPGSTKVQLWDSDCGNSNGATYEVGPAVLRPDGTVFATGYALVRITNSSTQHVFYCKTTKPSSYAVQSTTLQSTHFAVPANIETGPSVLEVVTNGIPSAKISVTVN